MACHAESPGLTRLDAEIAGVRCIGLNKVGMPGNLVGLDMPTRGRGYEILGEWPRREQGASSENLVPSEG